MTQGTARVLIVEDEFMLVVLMEELLPTLGYEVAGTAASVDEALHHPLRINFTFDCYSIGRALPHQFYGYDIRP